MDNQHRKISGYRELSQAEIDLMNHIKAIASGVGELVDEVTDFNDYDDVPHPDMRWVSIAKTHLQQGFMALTRSVAQPTTF
jgi:hypothetical protein